MSDRRRAGGSVGFGIVSTIVCVFLFILLFAGGYVVNMKRNANLKQDDVPVQDDLTALGMRVYKKNGCLSCHSTGEAISYSAPSHKGLFGRTETMQDGTKVLVDEAYIRESILNPKAKRVKGDWPADMIPYKDMLTEKEVDALVAYIRSLK